MYCTQCGASTLPAGRTCSACGADVEPSHEISSVATDLLGRRYAYFETRPVALDVALGGFATLVAALLRLIRLGGIPYGVHPDEAQIGLDAVRVLDHGWIGVYSHAALGVPTLNAYLTAPGTWLLGQTAFSLRLPLTLVGLAAVPLTYMLVRVACARVEAFFASLLLAVSYWHVFYSRLAHSSISYPTILLAALLCIMIGLKHDVRVQRVWFTAGGALLGLGIYAYNVDAIAVLAVATFLGVLTITRYRKHDALRQWWPSLALCFGAALIVALPFIWYISDPQAYYWEHIDSYRDTGIIRTSEYRDAGTLGRARIIADQLRDFAATYTWHGKPDIIDANGLRPVFDPMTLILLAGGIAIVIRRRREPMVVVSVCCVLILPLPALLQTGSMMREPLGAAPFVMFIAALPLAAAWRWSMRMSPAPERRAGIAALACAPVLIIGGLTVHDYFWVWPHDSLTRYVYHQQITSASLYMKTLPPDAYVLFYSERHPFALETRQWLASGIRGEDRSREFSGAGASIDLPQQPAEIVFVLLGDYLPLQHQIELRYPGGVARTESRDGQIDFYAYDLKATQP